MAKKPLKEYPNVALRIEDIDGRIDFSDIFGRKTAVHIEIGSGKGTFLVNQARAFPDIDFLGIEWANKYYRYAIDRIGRRCLQNVRLVRTEAASLIAKSIKKGAVERFHIYYPDPWPKKRHYKRRFICKENISQMIRCLKKNGIINFATDHTEYFQWALDAFEGFAKELEPVDFIRPAGANEGELVGTNYERKYIKEKRQMYTLAFKKR